MPKQIAIQNRFTRGLITEAHGLDFPEDACTATENCVFTLTGEVTRRLGIDLEINHSTFGRDYHNQAVSTFRWTNAGGDGTTELLVLQVGTTLFFYSSSSSTSNNPLSNQYISGATVNILQFQA